MEWNLLISSYHQSVQHFDILEFVLKIHDLYFGSMETVIRVTLNFTHALAVAPAHLKTESTY